MTKTTEFKWYSGLDGETYTATHDTREEAVAEVQDDGGYICHANKPILQLSDVLCLDMDRILEDADEHAVENYGSEDCDPIVELTEDQAESLRLALLAAADKWQEENGVSFTACQFHEIIDEGYIEEKIR